ncbi:nuclear transport factor 2 family protein [Halieaceae bacterium IMCC14734]|uniref:Nuclear transport factor 2 family protein n=1 Tax=Candidatus Litorirhabdus singularis TaxID=2518993 RepID=A0ABT3TJ50_9GAMM|nr:nuclear transport factor 2 family protein [Candidatus Litorirhabdus singularis]MCX2982338.1 nuclear transport factor 2 family protein [Candidatus Litorirhabdus singularis]
MDIDTLLAEHEITRQLIRFARAMDTRDWSALDTITVDNIEADLGAGELSGREAMVINMRSFLDACGPTQHLLGNIIVEVDGDTATSEAYVSDMHVGVGERAGESFSTLGDYHDHWRRLDGRWLMTQRRKLNRAVLGNIDVLGSGPGGWSA